MMDISKLEYSSSQHKFDFMIMLIFINSPISTPVAVLFTPLRLCFPLSFILCLYCLFFSTSFITLFFLHHSFLPHQSLLPPPFSSSFTTLFFLHHSLPSLTTLFLPSPLSSSSFTLFFLRHFRFLSSFSSSFITFLLQRHFFLHNSFIPLTVFFLHRFHFPSSFSPSFNTFLLLHHFLPISLSYSSITFLFIHHALLPFPRILFSLDPSFTPSFPSFLLFFLFLPLPLPLLFMPLLGALFFTFTLLLFLQPQSLPSTYSTLLRL